MRITAVAAACMVLLLGTSIQAAPQAAAETVTSFWLESSMTRVYPRSLPPPRGDARTLRIPAARNGRFSFQACVRSGQLPPLRVTCEASSDSGLAVQVRRVGFVPMNHQTIDTPLDDLDGVAGGFMPGLVPDPLFPEQTGVLGANETQPFWVTVRVPADAKPGAHTVKVRFDLGGGKHEELAATLDVSEMVIQRRKDFPVTHWWRAEAIWDHYKTGMWEDERLWTLTESYLRNYADHGNDVVYVPLFFMRREAFQRPAQLLKVTSASEGKYEFDWTNAQRFVDLARKCGVERFEWPHLWIYWGVENPIRVYTWQSGKAELLWPMDEPATSERFLTFLRQFLPQFHEFLKRNDILDKSYFHLSDEPGGDQHVKNYKRPRRARRTRAVAGRAHHGRAQRHPLRA